MERSFAPDLEKNDDILAAILHARQYTQTAPVIDSAPSTRVSAGEDRAACASAYETVWRNWLTRHDLPNHWTG